MTGASEINTLFENKKKYNTRRNNAHTEYNLSTNESYTAYINIFKILFFLLVVLVALKLTHRYRQTNKADNVKIAIVAALITGSIVITFVFKTTHL